MRSALIAAAALLAAAGTTQATETYIAHLSSTNVGVPSPATGTAIFILSNDLTSAGYNVSYTDLVGAQSGAHVHRWDTGSIAFDFGTGINPMIGTWQAIPPDDVNRLRTGQLYVNIHSSKYPTGEIQGTLLPDTTPVETTTWGRIKALYAR
jgi:hypothetical protein